MKTLICSILLRLIKLSHTLPYFGWLVWLALVFVYRAKVLHTKKIQGFFWMRFFVQNKLQPQLNWSNCGKICPIMLFSVHTVFLTLLTFHAFVGGLVKLIFSVGVCNYENRESFSTIILAKNGIVPSTRRTHRIEMGLWSWSSRLLFVFCRGSGTVYSTSWLVFHLSAFQHKLTHENEPKLSLRCKIIGLIMFFPVPTRLSLSLCHQSRANSDHQLLKFVSAKLFIKRSLHN